MRSKRKYEAPELTEYGSVEAVTEQGGFDKVGSRVDQYSTSDNNLDGEVFPD